jgi:hypothetical protein
MPGPDGLLRCPWALSATEYLASHDNEWGRPVTSVQGLAPLSGVAALLAGWTPMGVVFLLLGIAALLGGVALLYRPELPRRLVAWLTKRDDLPLTADGNERDWPDGATPRSPEVVSRVVAGGGERNVVVRAMACVSAPVRQPSHM